GVHRVRIGFENYLESLGGILMIADVPVRQTEVKLCLWPRRPLPNAGLEGFDSAPVVGTLEPQIPQTEPRVFPFRVASQQLQIELLGSFLVPLLLQHAR